jgi:serine/threonine protein kinase
LLIRGKISMSGETILNNRYELLAQQGSGGMSVVYRAVDRSLGRTVAIKILRPSLTQDHSFIAKFQNEARSIANLTHPNIITVHDVGSDGQTHYIVMELVDGQDLKKVINTVGALPLERALNLAIQICDGLGFAHRTGIVHADVKPQNILLTSNDIVKVTDFGIAQALTDTQPQQKVDVVWGSPHYFAPEQARGEQPTPAADVYSIGILMFEMLSGQLPYAGASQQALAMAHIKDRIPNVTEFNPNVPESLAKIVHRVMSKQPNQRYQNADQLSNVLRKYRDTLNANTLNTPPVPPRQQSAQQRPNTAPQPPQHRGTMPSPSQQPHAGYPQPPQPPSPYSSEPTAKYSAAPYAPQPYDPRQQALQGQPLPPAQSASSSGIQAPQPLEQRYTIPPPPQAPQQDSGAYSANYPPINETGSETDWVTIALAFLAFIAVVGLVPLYIAVLSARA